MIYEREMRQQEGTFEYEHDRTLGFRDVREEVILQRVKLWRLEYNCMFRILGEMG
jgi:hypothetical protein